MGRGQSANKLLYGRKQGPGPQDVSPLSQSKSQQFSAERTGSNLALIDHKGSAIGALVLLKDSTVNLITDCYLSSDHSEPLYVCEQEDGRELQINLSKLREMAVRILPYTKGQPVYLSRQSFKTIPASEQPGKIRSARAFKQVDSFGTHYHVIHYDILWKSGPDPIYYQVGELQSQQTLQEFLTTEYGLSSPKS